MTRERERDHLTPELFIDVAEGLPVDASGRQHLENCSECRQELEQLEQTLAILHDDVGTAAPPVRQTLRWWLATAAAIAISVSALYWMDLDRSGTAPASAQVGAVEDLLPPMEQDQEFQLLLALAGAMDEGEEISGVASPPFEGFPLDASGLTPTERQRFVEELTEAMRSSL